LVEIEFERKVIFKNLPFFIYCFISALMDLQILAAIFLSTLLHKTFEIIHYAFFENTQPFGLVLTDNDKLGDRSGQFSVMENKWKWA
jgi:hypothetical protein